MARTLPACDQRALGYPYEAPERSFVLAEGRAVEPSAWPGSGMTDHRPLLAYAAPAALIPSPGTEVAVFVLRWTVLLRRS